MTLAAAWAVDDHAQASAITEIARKCRLIPDPIVTGPRVRPRCAMPRTHAHRNASVSGADAARSDGTVRGVSSDPGCDGAPRLERPAACLRGFGTRARAHDHPRGLPAARHRDGARRLR